MDSFIPRHPFNPHRGKEEGLVTFLYLRRILTAQSDWLTWQLSHLYFASLPQTTYMHVPFHSADIAFSIGT